MQRYVRKHPRLRLRGESADGYARAEGTRRDTGDTGSTSLEVITYFGRSLASSGHDSQRREQMASDRRRRPMTK